MLVYRLFELSNSASLQPEKAGTFDFLVPATLLKCSSPRGFAHHRHCLIPVHLILSQKGNGIHPVGSCTMVLLGHLRQFDIVGHEGHNAIHFARATIFPLNNRHAMFGFALVVDNVLFFFFLPGILFQIAVESGSAKECSCT